jgi:enamine deaminase RidA (YjgF/YER057c/UK114 family)
MSTQRVSSASPYEPLVGYCRALKVGDRILVSGTAPIDDEGGAFAPGDPEAQARRCFEVALRAVEQLGGKATQVVRTRMYLTRAEDWEAVARVHGEQFGNTRPVATAVVVNALINPDWLLEIEVEADLRSAPAV